MSQAPSSAEKFHQWTIPKLRRIASGTATPDLAGQRDQLGLSAADWGAMQAAQGMTAILELLVPTQDAEQEDRIGDLIGIMTAVVERMEALEREMIRLRRAVERGDA